MAAEAVNHAWIHMVVTASVVAQTLIAALTVTHTAVVQLEGVVLKNSRGSLSSKYLCLYMGLLEHCP